MKRKILQYVLGIITKIIIKKHNPRIIAVTGSVGKTTTKNTVAFLLENFFSVRKSVGNLNTEFGAPLVFIGKNRGGGNSFFSWIKIIFSGLILCMKKDYNYPEIVIMEMGADKPGDISYLTKIVKPDISIVTLIGEVPVHLSNYNNLNQLVSEKSKIVEVLRKENHSILNFDDYEVRRMKEKTESKVIYFGFDETSEIKISDIKYELKKNKFNGISFNIIYKDSIKKIEMPHCYGKSFCYSVAASIACALALKINFKNINSNVFKNLKPEKARMNMIESKNQFFILDDTYNASPVSMKSALETISRLNVNQRIVVLGDMRELGNESEKAHREIGEIVFGIADFLITVGEESKKIKEKVIEMGFNNNNVFHFERSEDAAVKVKEIIKPGNLILIKGSRSVEMEKITEYLSS